MKPIAWLFLSWCLAVAAGALAAEQITVDLDALRRNAEAGDRVAQYNLGVLHEAGQHGVVMDKAQAVSWYRKSAEQGYENAQYNLGVMYLRGEGVAADRDAAIRWFRLAAAQMNPAALSALEKLGVEPPPTAAGDRGK